MNYTISFIDKTVLTDRTDLPVSYSATNVRNSILDAQQYELYDIIGKNLYERFNQDIDDDTYGTESYKTSFPKYFELMDEYITPYVMWTAYIRILNISGVRPTGLGGGRRTVDSFTPATLAEAQIKKDGAVAKALYAESKLREYLNKFSNDFEEWTETTDLLSDKPNLTKSQVGKVARFGVNKNIRNGY